MKLAGPARKFFSLAAALVLALVLCVTGRAEETGQPGTETGRTQLDVADNWSTEGAEPEGFTISGQEIRFSVTGQPSGSDLSSWQGRSVATGVAPVHYWEMRSTLTVTPQMIGGADLSQLMEIQVHASGDRCVDWCDFRFIHQDGTPGWQVWDNGENGWKDVGGAVSVGPHSLRTVFHNGHVVQYLDGEAVHEYDLRMGDTLLRRTAPAVLCAQACSVGEDREVSFGVPSLCTAVPESAAVAAIGDRYYAALEDAVQEVGRGGTITLLCDVADGEGLTVESGKQFTVDFAGHTYTVGCPGDTQTNAFQFLQDAAVTFRNGTLRISDQNTRPENGNPIRRLIQNYGDLTLENMQIYGANQRDGENYLLSFNNGNTVFAGNTSIYTTDPANTTVFDLYYWQDYYPQGCTVTFAEDYTGTIQGYIEYYSTDKTKVSLTIRGKGRFQGIRTAAATVNGADILVYGGDFACDPGAYLAGNRTVSPGVSEDYRYAVTAQTGEARVVPGGAEVKDQVQQDPGASAAEKELAAQLASVLGQLSVQGQSLTEAAGAVADAGTVTADQGRAALEQAGITVDPREDVAIVIQPYLAIELQQASVDSAEKSFTLDVTPMYRTLATTGTGSILLSGEAPEGAAPNGVELAGPAELDLAGAVTMCVELPAEFASDGDTLFVFHWKSPDLSYCYEGQVDDRLLTFTNPDGFSVFTITCDTRKAVIALEGKDYTLTGNLVGTALPAPAKGTFQGLEFEGLDVSACTVLTDELLDQLSGLYAANGGRAIAATAVFAQQPSGSDAVPPADSGAAADSGTPVTDSGIPAGSTADGTTQSAAQEPADGKTDRAPAPQPENGGAGKADGANSAEPAAAAPADGAAAVQNTIPQTGEELPLAGLTLAAAAALAGLAALRLLQKRSGR